MATSRKTIASFIAILGFAQTIFFNLILFYMTIFPWNSFLSLKYGIGNNIGVYIHRNDMLLCFTHKIN
jgi:hypothetical protein